MSSRDRITKARSAALIIHDFCVALGIPIAIYGHTEDYDVEIYSYAEYDSQDGKDAYRLMDMSSRCGNRDGAALRFAAERLMTRAEDLKLLFLISDGSRPVTVITVLPQKQICAESSRNIPGKGFSFLPPQSEMTSLILNAFMEMVF